MRFCNLLQKRREDFDFTPRSRLNVNSHTPVCKLSQTVWKDCLESTNTSARCVQVFTVLPTPPTNLPFFLHTMHFLKLSTRFGFIPSCFLTAAAAVTKCALILRRFWTFAVDYWLLGVDWSPAITAESHWVKAPVVFFGTTIERC